MLTGDVGKLATLAYRPTRNGRMISRTHFFPPRHLELIDYVSEENGLGKAEALRTILDEWADGKIRGKI